MVLAILTILTTVLYLTDGFTYETKYGYRDWTKYEVGNSSIILSSGHGGLMEPREMDYRENGCHNGTHCNYDYRCSPKTTQCKVTTVTDGNTFDITIKIANALRSMGIYPHVIFMIVKRTLIDVNRPIDQACGGRTECENLYKSYHGFIADARNATGNVIGLYLDIHGQKHPANWTELGYRITKSELNSGEYNNIRSSINHLKIRSGLTLKQLFTGDQSFGKLFSDYNYKTVPSPEYPSPGSEGYYRGGYCTEEYGSQIDGGCTDAIQIELPRSLRFSSSQTTTKLSKDLAKTIKSFMEMHKYGDPSWRCGSTMLNPETKMFAILLLVAAYLCK